VIPVHVLIDDDGSGRFRWRLERRDQRGADLVARGARAYGDRRTCHRVAMALADAADDAVTVVCQSDGHWSWTLAGDDGEPVADSPAVFRDAVTCHQAFSDARRALNGLRPPRPVGSGETDPSLEYQSDHGMVHGDGARRSLAGR
jgi:hypothetical protein